MMSLEAKVMNSTSQVHFCLKNTPREAFGLVGSNSENAFSATELTFLVTELPCSVSELTFSMTELTFSVTENTFSIMELPFSMTDRVFPPRKKPLR